MFSNLTFKISSVLLSSKVLRKQIEWCPYPSVAWRSALVHRTMCRMSLHLSTSTLTPCVIHPSSRIRIILIFGIKTILISTLEFWNTQKQHLIWILGRIGLPNPYPNFTKIRITYPGLKYPILRFNPIQTNLIQINFWSSMMRYQQGRQIFSLWPVWHREGKTGKVKYHQHNGDGKSHVMQLVSQQKKNSWKTAEATVWSPVRRGGWAERWPGRIYLLDRMQTKIGRSQKRPSQPGWKSGVGDWPCQMLQTGQGGSGQRRGMITSVQW